MTTSVDLVPGQVPGADEYVRAAMQWHFDPRTGSPFWLERDRTLGFDPRTDVRTIDDLGLFPNVVGELRDVRVQDLIPRGYGDDPDIVGVYESGGSTGAPKRVLLFADWLRYSGTWSVGVQDACGVPRRENWLSLAPTGPHIVDRFFQYQIRRRGGIRFAIDMDPRWVKGLVADGRTDESYAYTQHLLQQAAHVLRSQDIGVLMATRPYCRGSPVTRNSPLSSTRRCEPSSGAAPAWTRTPGTCCGARCFLGSPCAAAMAAR
jgi:hypothetical protein